MFLSNISIQRPVFATMMNLLIIVFGFIAYQKIGVDNQPKIDIPIVNIRVNVSGATPRYIEQNVLDPIETSLRSIEGVDTIYSTATTGSVSIRVNFILDQDINVAVNNIRNAMTSLTGRNSWPSNAQTPIVRAVDPNASAILQVSISSLQPALNTGALSQFINDIFVPNMEQAQGVGEVTVSGLRLPQYQILFDSQKLNAFNITAVQVIDQIEKQIVTMPGGNIRNDQVYYNIDANTNPNSVQDVEQMPITLPSGQTIKLSEFAKVLDTIQDMTSYGESDGKNAIIVSIAKASNANTVQVAKNARQALKKMQEAEVSRIHFRVVNDTSKFISESLDAVQHDIMMGSILTVLIVFLFLHDWKATLISAIAIPTSVIGSIAIMQLMGFTLNSMSTLALSLSIGVIVDDAIVVIENIHRHVAMGKEPFQATRDAMAEIGIPALAITFAIVAVFLPVAFMDGIIGRFFYEFGITVSVSVLISLFVAFTLTPTLSSRLLFTSHHPTKKWKFLVKIDNILYSLENIYIKTIEYTLKNKYKTVLVGISFFILSVFLLHFVSTTFQPKVDTSYFSVGMQLNPNTDLPTTINRAREVELWLKSFPGIDNVFFRTGNNSEATFMINLVPPEKRAFTQIELEKRIRKEIVRFKKNPDEVLSIGKPGRIQQSIQVVLTHPNSEIVTTYAKNLEKYMATLDSVVDVSNDTPPASEQIKVTPNFLLANSLGVSASDIARTISYLFYEEVVGTYNSGGSSYDIIARINKDQSKTPNDLLYVSVPGRNESLVSLGSVAKINMEKQNSVIQHYNGMREYTVVADYVGRDLGGVINNIKQHIQETSVPGLSYSFSGDAKNLQDSNSAVITALWLSFLFAYMVLCSQFESFLTPFIIILSVPLAFSGAFIFLLIFGQPMSLYAMVGLILLTGLVKKNAILLLDFAEQSMKQGASVVEALKQAGKMRLRPILMTTFAMIFGMLPMAFGTNLGHEQRAPMGIAVIGGLISSTLLTLVIIPCLFQILVNLKQWARQKWTSKNAL
jgi:HAE1 family hydrophobic/amphiphilic exporter-1